MYIDVVVTDNFVGQQLQETPLDVTRTAAHLGVPLLQTQKPYGCSSIKKKRPATLQGCGPTVLPGETEFCEAASNLKLFSPKENSTRRCKAPGRRLGMVAVEQIFLQHIFKYLHQLL